jgi:hypothetical protein
LSSDGETAFAQSLAAINKAEGGFEGGAFGTTYTLKREPGGWAATPIAPAVAEFPGQFFITGEPGDGSSLWALHTPQQSVHAHNLYLRSPTGAFTKVGPLWQASATAGPPSNAGSELGATRVVGATEDFSHVLFILPSGAAYEGKRVLFPGDRTLNGNSLYAYSGVDNAEPTLVGVSGGAGSSTLISECGTTFGGVNSEYNAISRDGETIFFTPTAGECEGENEAGEFVTATGPTVAEVYARIGMRETLAISEPSLTVPGRECTGECAEAQNEENGHTRSAATFVGASDDGSRVFFLTSQQLVNADKDTTRDLYEAVISDGAVSALRLVSATPSGEAAEVRGISRISPNASSVYFVASGVLAENAGAAVDPETGVPQTATPGAPNLYVYRDGHLTFVATLSEADTVDWRATEERPVQTTPDGSHLLFLSHAQLTLGDKSIEAAPQLFEYDAQTAELARVSVGEEGYAENGNILSFPNETAEENYQRVLQRDIQEAHSFEFDRHARNGALNMSDDGSTIVFSSTAQLTPGAFSAAGGCTTVYEYKSSGSIGNGTVHLASDGRDVQPNIEDCGAEFDAMDASGTNVLLDTADQLTGADTNTQRDIYDVRVDGGFAVSQLLGSCEAEGCRGPLTPTPSSPAAMSATQAAGENVAPVAAPPAPPARPKLIAHSASANGLTIRLQVSEPGTITVTGGGLKRLSRRVTKAGTITVRATLTTAARNKLRRQKLKITVHVAFKGASGATTSMTTTANAKRSR